MSKIHVKVWNRNKVRAQNNEENKEAPEELLASYISQSKLIDENSNRDLFWVIRFFIVVISYGVSVIIDLNCI